MVSVLPCDTHVGSFPEIDYLLATGRGTCITWKISNSKLLPCVERMGFYKSSRVSYPFLSWMKYSVIIGYPPWVPNLCAEESGKQDRTPLCSEEFPGWLQNFTSRSRITLVATIQLPVGPLDYSYNWRVPTFEQREWRKCLDLTLAHI